MLELYGHVKVMTARDFPDYMGQAFQLLAGYPPKVLLEPNTTLKEAGLNGSRITQKMSAI